MFRTHAEISKAHSASDCSYGSVCVCVCVCVFLMYVCVCVLATVAMVEAPLNGRVSRPVLNSRSLILSD